MSSFLIEYERRYSKIVFLTDDVRQKIRSDYLDRVEIYLGKGLLFEHADREFNHLLRCWIFLLEERNDETLYARFGKAFASAILDDAMLSRLLPFFVRDNRFEDRTNEYVVWADIDDMKRHFGKDGMVAIVDTLAKATERSEWNFKTLKALRWAMNEKRSGRPYGIQEQKQYMSDLPNQESFKAEMREYIGKDGEKADDVKPPEDGFRSNEPEFPK